MTNNKTSKAEKMILEVREFTIPFLMQEGVSKEKATAVVDDYERLIDNNRKLVIEEGEREIEKRIKSQEEKWKDKDHRELIQAGMRTALQLLQSLK